MAKDKSKDHESLKSEQLSGNRENSDGTYLTTSTGVKISDTDNFEIWWKGSDDNGRFPLSGENDTL